MFYVKLKRDAVEPLLELGVRFFLTFWKVVLVLLPWTILFVSLKRKLKSFSITLTVPFWSKIRTFFQKQEFYTKKCFPSSCKRPLRKIIIVSIPNLFQNLQRRWLCDLLSSLPKLTKLWKVQTWQLYVNRIWLLITTDTKMLMFWYKISLRNTSKWPFYTGGRLVKAIHSIHRSLERFTKI